MNAPAVGVQMFTCAVYSLRICSINSRRRSELIRQRECQADKIRRERSENRRRYIFRCEFQMHRLPTLAAVAASPDRAGRHQLDYQANSSRFSLKRGRPGVAALLVTLLTQTTATAQRVIPDDPVCAKCQIEISAVARLGDVDGPGAIPTVPLAVSRDGQGRYWLTFASSMPLVFSASGQFLRETGRPGAGPNEFRSVTRVVPLPGDSILLLDPVVGRATVLTGDFTYGRAISFQSGQLWDFV